LLNTQIFIRKGGNDYTVTENISWYRIYDSNWRPSHLLDF
jgi:hypothetical protein